MCCKSITVKLLIDHNLLCSKTINHFFSSSRARKPQTSFSLVNIVIYAILSQLLEQVPNFIKIAVKSYVFVSFSKTQRDRSILLSTKVASFSGRRFTFSQVVWRHVQTWFVWTSRPDVVCVDVASRRGLCGRRVQTWYVWTSRPDVVCVDVASKRGLCGRRVQTWFVWTCGLRLCIINI
jgi:hypothetical protein